MQAVAQAHNLAEIAFVAPKPGEGWYMRWFTPAQEPDVCCQATLATEHWVSDTRVDEVTFEVGCDSYRLDIPLPDPEGRLSAFSFLLLSRSVQSSHSLRNGKGGFSRSEGLATDKATGWYLGN